MSASASKRCSMPWKISPASACAGACSILSAISAICWPSRAIGLLGNVGAGGDVVDALGKRAEPVDDLGRRLVLRHLLDLHGKRGDARLDALERLGIEMRRLGGDRRGDDGARDFVEPFVDQAEHLVAVAVVLAHELVDRACKRADLFLDASAATAIPAGC